MGKKTFVLITITLVLATLFASLAYCETDKQQQCKQIYEEFKLLREKIRAQIGDKTSFDVDRDKELFETYIKYKDKDKEFNAKGCTQLPLLMQIENTDKNSPLNLFFVYSLHLFPWTLEYQQQRIPLYNLGPKYINYVIKDPEIAFKDTKACIFRAPRIGLLEISCPFIQLEKQWSYDEPYKITRAGNLIEKNEPIIKKGEMGSLYDIYLTGFWIDISNIKLEPEMKTWFEKEFGTLRKIIKK